LPEFPVVSGSLLVKVLGSPGYTVLRQRGSHVQLSKNTPAGEHRITVPLHEEIAKGTLNDIVTKVSQWNCIAKDDLLDLLR